MATIQKIGVEAISKNENMVILFNETANEKLSRVAAVSYTHLTLPTILLV